MSDTLAKLQAMLGNSGRLQGLGPDVRFKIVPQIVCADGLAFSVQTSSHHYCTPRDDRGPWTEAEVGFPSERIEEFLPYIDGDPETIDPTSAVYGYVPLDLIAKVIDAHGGIREV